LASRLIADSKAAEALRITGLKSPGPLTKEEIEAGLTRLANTGMYADLSYKVNGEALTISLTPSASSQLRPVIFANFVWWQPAELEPLVEARVPAFHGKLPAAGTLTEQVDAALVALLHEKGIDAKVEARESGISAGAVTVSIVSPRIVIDKLQMQGSLPALATKITGLQHSLKGQDFDLGGTTKSIQDTVNDEYRNAGYLDVVTSAPTYSAPHKDLNDYATDVTAAVRPGEPYHVARLAIQAAPPVSQADLDKEGEIKTGDVASPMEQRIAQGKIERAYQLQGYLDAQAAFKITKDSAAHTVAYDVTISPGEIYHFVSLDVSALPSDQQASFKAAFTVAPGAVAGNDMRLALRNGMLSIHSNPMPKVNEQRDRTRHTVSLVIVPAAASNSQ